MHGKSHDKSNQPLCLSAALVYAEFGWSVFPADIRNSKHKRSYKAARYSRGGARWGATRDLKQIKRDFKKWPTAAIGIPTGIDNGFFVVEADTLEGHDVDGIANLQALIDANGPLPETRMARSPSGSIHYFFSHPNRGLVRNSTGVLRPGIDVRGEGGMIVVAPSVRPGVGEYTWLNRAGLKFAPPWLIEAVTEKPTKYQPGGDPCAPFNKVAEALDLLSNDESSRWQVVNADGVVLKELKGWDGWNIIAMAIYRGTSGSDEGYEIFDRWTRKHPRYDNEQSKRDTWHTWYKRFPSCRPIRTTVATLFAVVDDEHPGWQAIWNEEHDDDDNEIDASFAAARQKYEARHD